MPFRGSGTSLALIDSVATTRHALGDRLLTAFSMCVLVAALAGIDDRVRDFFASTLPSTSTSDLAMVAGRAHGMAYAALHATGLQASNHATMVIFGLVGLSLTILMLRT